MRNRTRLTQPRRRIREQASRTQITEATRIHNVACIDIADVTGCHVVAVQAVCRAAVVAEGVGGVEEVVGGFVAGCAGCEGGAVQAEGEGARLTAFCSHVYKIIQQRVAIPARPTSQYIPRIIVVTNLADRK